jgi:hypothetical protein
VGDFYFIIVILRSLQETPILSPYRGNEAKDQTQIYDTCHKNFFFSVLTSIIDVFVYFCKKTFAYDARPKENDRGGETTDYKREADVEHTVNV